MFKTYEKIIETHLKETNAYGNIYFSRHFDWQGDIRESFVKECIPIDFLKLPVKLLTKEASLIYKGATYPFQTIKALVNVFNLKKISGSLYFRFYDNVTGIKLSEGTQKIAFVDYNDKFCRLPEQLYRIFESYEIDPKLIPLE